MTQEDRNELLFVIFSAGYEKSVQRIPLAQAFKEFLQELHDAEQEMIKNGQKITL